MTTRVFIAELFQDIPLWIALIMSFYPEFQNQKIFLISLGVGTGATFFLLKEMKSGNYSFENLFKNASEAVAFIIYSFLLLIILIILTFQDRLYMSTLVWAYIIIGSIGEIVFMKR